MLNFNRMELYLNFEYVLEEDQLALFKEYILKRTQHVPIQYILNKAHFRSIELYVDKDVLIPRPETELLVDRLLISLDHYIEEIKENNLEIGCVNILEIGTGSGAITISLAKEIEIENTIDWHIIATEKSSSALEIAKKNAGDLLGVEQLKKIEFINADIVPAFSNVSSLVDGGSVLEVSSVSQDSFSNRYRSSINIVVSNPPYISSENYEKLPKEVRDFEPRAALYAGKEGLDVYEKILESILPYINKKLCVLLFETSPDISSSLKGLMIKKLAIDTLKVKDISIVKDYNQLDRVLVAILTEGDRK